MSDQEKTGPVLAIALVTVVFFFRSDAAFGQVKPVKTLVDCIRLGLTRHGNLKLAEEEVELARLKLQEATRSFYPALAFKAEETRGKAQDVVSPDFKERVMGASLSYDLIRGGRTLATYRQTKHAYESSEINREKTLQDFTFGVREAYWTLASASRALKGRKKAYEIIKGDLNMVTEQYVLDLTVKQQFLGVKAQYLKANTRFLEAKKGFAQARWNLAKAMGLNRPPEFEIDTAIPYKKLEVDLQECLRLATTHRPDLLMQEHLVQSALQGTKVARANKRPILQLNGFLGRSGAAFESETLTLREDWQVNAKLTQRIFANTLDVHSSAIKTSPKLGESSRTDTETNGLNIRFLDGLKSRTDTKKADLEYRRAKLKLNDLKKEIAIDVENAFYNINQTILQVGFSEEDLKLAEEELKVAESKRKYGLAEVLEVARARNRYTESQSARTDALAAYQIALASLNRAIGVADRFVVK